MPVSRDFSKYPSGCLGRSPPPSSLHRALMEGDTPPPEPLQPYLKVPIDEPTPGCPNRAAI